MTVILDSVEDFNLTNLRRVAWQGQPVRFGPAALARMKKSRADFLHMVDTVPGLHIYGVTTGFGDNAAKLLNAEERQTMAKHPSFIQSVAVGPEMPPRIVRAMIMTRLLNYVSGYAAVSLETAQAVADMLDGRPLPVVRRWAQDSEGELHQFFNLYHHLMGEMSQVRDQNALRNGSGCSAGILGDMALRTRRRVQLATRVFALSIDVGHMGTQPYDPALKSVLIDPFEHEAIDLLNRDLADLSGDDRREYQSPISWRILTRVLGHLLHSLSRLEWAADITLTQVNDNPVYLGPDAAPPYGRCITTGGFHVPQAYQMVNWMKAAWADVAAIAARQVALLHNGEVSRLPHRLMIQKNGRRGSTFFFSTTAYDMARRIQDEAAPATIPLYVGHDTQTDTIFPLFQAWESENSVSRYVDLLLAMLAATASQGLAAANSEPAPSLRAFVEDVRRHFPPVDGSRDMGGDIDKLADAFGAAVMGDSDAFGLPKLD
ncbi:MAG: aromatic amino acid lyase [Alphaproteobacteria bacterium]